MFKNLKDKRVLSFLTYRFLVSMTLVLICTMISSALSYDVLQKKMSEWSININNKMIKNYNDLFKSSIIASSDKIYNQILQAKYNDKNMKELKYFLENPLQKNLLAISDINSYFIGIAQSNPIISEVGIFIKDNHLIISNNTVKYDYFYDSYKKEIDYFLAKSREIESSGDVNNLNAYAVDNTVQIIRPLVMADRVTALIFVNYRIDAFNKKLNESIADKMGTLLVLNKQGAVIYDNSGENLGKNYRKLSFYSKNMDSGSSGYYFVKKEKSSNIVSYMTDDKNLRYISLIPEQFYMEPVQYMLKNLIICTIVSLLVGMLFTIIMSIWQSKPINKIIKICDETCRTNSAGFQFMDAYDFIRSTLKGLMNKVETQTQEINKLMPILRNNFSVWFMSAKPSDACHVNDTMLLMRVEFPFEKYAIIAVKAVFVMEDATLEDEEYEPGYALAEACMVLERAFNTNDSVGVFSINSGYITGLVNFSCNNGVFEERCEGLFKQAFHGYRFYVASGQISTELEKLTGTAVSIIDALQYSYLYPEYKYFSYELLCIHMLSVDKNDVLNDISNLADSVKHRDADRAAALLYTIVKKLRYGGFSVQFAQNIMMETGSVIERLIGRSELNKELIAAFQACKDILSLQKALNDIIFKEFNEKTEVPGTSMSLVNAGKDYIDRHLTDKQLSLQMVSEELKVTTQYLSQIFHDTVGMTFTEYITTEKMKLANKLLLETDMNINKISEITGYSSPQYFIRRYKMYFGVTPNIYRERMKNNLLLGVTS